VPPARRERGRRRRTARRDTQKPRSCHEQPSLAGAARRRRSRALAAAAPPRPQVLHVQLTSEADPFFLHTLEVSEDDFQTLKVCAFRMNAGAPARHALPPTHTATHA
jgi:hypothetical protein